MKNKTALRMDRKTYLKELKHLHEELVALQRWVQAKGLRVCIIFEGRDGAGKGGTIKAITERVNPRVFRTVALPAPTEREKSQMFMQRYVAHLPAAGEIQIFDRSWYNRAGVERVMGFCSADEYKRFLATVPFMEKAIVENGIILLKYWLDVDMDEQERRLRDRVHDKRKIWKLSPMDMESFKRWYDYSRARDDMLDATDTVWAPWYVVDSNDKKKARLNIIAHMLAHIPYEHLKIPKIEFPPRQKPKGYKESSRARNRIEDRYAGKVKDRKRKKDKKRDAATAPEPQADAFVNDHDAGQHTTDED